MRRHRRMSSAVVAAAAASILLMSCSGGGSTTATTTSAAPAASTTSTTSTTSIAPTTTTTSSTTSTTTSTTSTTSTSTSSSTTTSTTSAPGTTSPPPHQGPSQVVRVLPQPAVAQRQVALTLDAGSDLGFTHSILETLADQGVVASFGITGSFAEEHPDAIRRMAAEGHHVVNHTYSHRSYTGVSSTQVFLTAAERQADLDRAETVLVPLTGSTRPFWRPPFGDYDEGVLADVGATGWGVTVMWSIDTLGWQGLSADEILARVLERVEPGAIVLMHVGSASQDGPVLGRMIDELRARGYGFTTVRAAWEASVAAGS